MDASTPESSHIPADASDVSVIGLGEMGSAIARAFVDAGYRVTVWNRTAAKAAPLVERGAVAAGDAAAAVAASPVIGICLSSYRAASELLDATDVAGRLVVQLGSGTPSDARDLATRLEGRGAAYLDGAVASWPRQVGTSEGGVAISGPRELYTRHADLLGALGAVTFVGEPVGHASALAAAALSYLAGRWIGFAHGALICQAEGLNVAEFGELLAGMSPMLGDDDRHMGEVVEHDRYSRPESTLRTVAADIADLVRHAADVKIGADFPNFAADVFRRGVDAGFGTEEHVAIVKVLAGVRA